MIIFKLFLDLFKFMLFCFTHRKRLKQVLFMLFKVVNILLRKLEQHNLRPAFLPHEKFLIAALFEGTEHAERFFNLVTPNTILSAWKNIFSKLWAQKKHKPGRPPITKAIKELILKMKNENRLWGSRRIRDELLKLSVKVSHETISKTIQHFMKENVIKPTLAWKKFISSNLKTLFACDFFTVDIFGFKRFYAFFIIQLETRKIVQFSCTDHPNMLFVRNQLSCFSEQFPNVHLIHDNSGELK
ncbi:MAG: helix-turn-helix domain-containing protein, partial [Treponema sp.]|nr:helix-turn-helix domain-containing protein [Treponema sp.]